MVQWLRIPLPMQETQVQSLVQEDSTCHGATKPVHNYRALHSGAREPQLLSLCAATPEPTLSRAHALQQAKPLQREARALQPESSPCAPQLEKGPHHNGDLVQPKMSDFFKG